jgi:hypothetical protein
MVEFMEFASSTREWDLPISESMVGLSPMEQSGGGGAGFSARHRDRTQF